jgi:hypothetical protein
VNDHPGRLRSVAAVLAPALALGVASSAHAQPAATAESSAATTVAGEGRWCNDEPIAVLGEGFAASPYPSSITVDGADNTTTGVTVELVGFNHPRPLDVQVMLVGPTGQNLVLMSDTGGWIEVTGVGLTFDDDAGEIPQPR